MTRHPINQASRRAFTLVEILVVIGIIALLASITAVASFYGLHSARVSSTRVTVKKIDELLNQRMSGFQRALEGREVSGGRRIESELLAKYRGYVQGSLGQKRLAQKFFGMGFGETSRGGDAAPGTPLRWTTSALNSAELLRAGYIPANHLPETENAEMLYWTINNGPTFGADPVDKDAFASDEVADTDGDGLMEFVDAWGTPIRFYRWPTRLLRPAPPTAPGSQASGSEAYFALGPDDDGDDTLDAESPAIYLIASLPTFGTASSPAEDRMDPTAKVQNPLGQDRDDPFGEALAAFAAEGSYGNAAAAARAFEQRYHTLNTWHAPLIVAAGPDRDFGLFAPSDVANFGHLAQPMPNAGATGYSEAIQDNISNLNSQTSGAGGR